MYDLWENHFNDVPRKNYVLIKFGKRAKRQLGCIKWVKSDTKVRNLLRKKKRELGYHDHNSVSLITVTSLYKDPQIPQVVVEATIAHEMIHYAHGFFSPLKQLYDHPHKGGIIRKEMIKRGLRDMYYESKRWLKENWPSYVRYR
jgi:hypothetical protein